VLKVTRKQQSSSEVL